MKNYSELTLTDDYLFSQVMKDESVCKPFLEMLLEIKIAKIEYLQEQKELNLFPDSKGVRLDVYLEEGWTSTLKATERCTTSKCRQDAINTSSAECVTTERRSTST